MLPEACEQVSSPTRRNTTPVALLSIRGISKRFPGVQALKDVSFDIDAGEVVAVVGENGAGKTTLMHILAGSLDSDGGEVLWNGAPLRLTSPRDANALGINTVYQELSLFPHLSVAENIELGALSGFGSWRKARASAQSKLARVGIEADANLLQLPVGQVPLATAQLIEIAKAAAGNCRLLILDEPTSALSATETEQLYKVVRDLSASGVAVLFVTHRLVEVFALSSRIVVLKDGAFVGERATKDTDQSEIIRMMVGRDLSLEEHEQRPATATVLAARDWSLRGGNPMSFEFAGSQIVGIGGLADSGKADLLLSFIGEASATGQLTLAAKPYQPTTPAAARRQGIAYLPSDRKSDGILPGLSVLDNLLVESSVGVGAAGLVSRRERLSAYIDRRRKFDIRAGSPDMQIRNLSGGNQQKVLIARAFEAAPKVLLVDEPTRGVDVGAKSEIYRLLRSLADSGALVIVASSEVPELLHLCDQILIMRGRSVAADLPRSEATEEAVSHALIYHGEVTG
jgi:rhamnose transport system ATP-binding protein